MQNKIEITEQEIADFRALDFRAIFLTNEECVKKILALREEEEKAKAEHWQEIFKRIVKNCMFNSVDAGITYESLPIIEEPSTDTEFTLVNLNYFANLKEAQAEIEKRGLVPATFAELLFYIGNNQDIRNPYRNEERMYIALGSRCQDPYGNWCSPYAKFFPVYDDRQSWLWGYDIISSILLELGLRSESECSHRSSSYTFKSTRFFKYFLARSSNLSFKF